MITLNYNIIVLIELLHKYNLAWLSMVSCSKTHCLKHILSSIELIFSVILFLTSELGND